MTSESKVNVYGAAFERVLRSASGSFVIDTDGNRYFDLFSSAGVVNFGHNHPTLKAKLVEYLDRDGLVHGLDYFTESKLRFIDLMETRLLPEAAKRRYHYYFSPPTGTLAMEAAIKYARKITARSELACFTNAFHGLTYNALSITGNVSKRRAAYCDLLSVMRLPYDGYYGGDFDYLAAYRRAFDDKSGGGGLPAAVVFETIQAEGGCHTARPEWYEGVLDLCRERGIVSIVDEIQAGCGRTGEYFSFRALGDSWPDIICLSKSISGLGLPLSLVLVRKDLDVLDSGENSGTFRGNCLAVESAANTIELFVHPAFQDVVRANQVVMTRFVERVTDLGLGVRGRGLLRGVVLPSPARAARIVSSLRTAGILVETCGGAPDTLKVMPPLATPTGVLAGVLDRAVGIIKDT